MMKGLGLDESMSNLTSTLSNETSISSNARNDQSSSTTTANANTNAVLYTQASSSSFASPNQPQLLHQPPPAKKKRGLPGNPDPDAEVIALSPKSLLATNRFICEICNKGFQRDQNLQLHRRSHNLPWKEQIIRKKVYVCPEPSCVHHEASQAFGDLSGIKKHFYRKHGEKWKCEKCSKKYAVRSDWKAHSEICGTPEYRCDCGTLFSRRDSFITHRAFCDALAEQSARGINPLSTLPSSATDGMSGITTDSSTPLSLFSLPPHLTSHHQLPQSLPLEREQPDNHQHHQQLGHGQHSNIINVRSDIPPWLACPPPHHDQPPLKYTQDTLSQTEALTVKPQIVYVDPSQFKSAVHRLTGLLAIDTNEERNQLVWEIPRQSKAYEDMYSCLNSLKILHNPANVSQECLDCLVYCSLFPKDYEIDRDTLIQLWMAEDLIKDEPMEDIAASYLRALCKHGEYISLLREDYGTGKIWYKIKRFEISEQVLEISKITPVRAISEDPTSVLSATETENYHVTLQRLRPTDLRALGRFSKISTLLLLRNHKANVASIPYDFFMSLQHLRALDLSRTKVSELPSSIGNARSLRYLDLSETLIKRLPETTEFLLNLQTLKLQNCPRLVALPKATSKLMCLRHLDLGTVRHMHSMPAGMGALTSLRTLTEFIAGRCRIRELKNMNDIEGKLCLSKLENVVRLDDAKEAKLNRKRRLKNLELRWTDDEHQESIGVNHEVIKYLQPHTNLQDLRIICYGGSTFPSWISHPSFVKLTKITLFKCPSCQILPSLGQLPLLESLSLIELAGVRIIDFHFRRDKLTAAADDNDQFVAFPALHKLEIESMLNLEKWSDIEKVDFPCLGKFSIKNCPKLADLCELTNIKALEYLEINQCTMLPSLPEEKLPASLETLIIEGCPSFSLSRSADKNSDWIEQQHSPSLSIYQRNENGKEMNSMAGSSVMTHDPPLGVCKKGPDRTGPVDSGPVHGP